MLTVLWPWMLGDWKDSGVRVIEFEYVLVGGGEIVDGAPFMLG